jgi:diguanylate cyclase (GGDEF)-like protein
MSEKEQMRPLSYSIVLFIVAVAAVAVSMPEAGLLAGDHGWWTALFFLLFAVFSIATGFPHPVMGHVSFDRVAQVASILVLGPVDAAWINGVASFIYPLYRLTKGVPVSVVIMASLHNAGLMALAVLAGGLLYQYIGGPVPLTALDFRTGTELFVLVLAMQIVNDIGMMVTLWLRNMDPRSVFNLFTAVVEFFSAAVGVVLAIAYINEPLPNFVLLLLVFAGGMVVIMKYALMRYRLERLVDERTEELRVQADEFERQATHDKLTRLPNRRYADDYLEQQIELAHRNKHQGAVALADIDHFKKINDDHSHAKGDIVLRRVARILKEGCRRSDFVARYGGEEFLLCFPETDGAHAGKVCNELRRAIEEADWSDIAEDFGVTISFGVAECKPESRRRTVLNEADKRLYRAKREGRNRVVLD